MFVLSVGSWMCLLSALGCNKKVIVPDKHGVHFPVLEGILNFLTLPFSIHPLPIISFRFLFLLKAVIGCSWNNSHRLFLVWRMFQFLRTTAVRFGVVYILWDNNFKKIYEIQGGRNWCWIPWKNGEKYIKNIVLGKWRNLFHGGMYLCENLIFSALICYVDHFINQKRYYQLKLTRSCYFRAFKNGTEFMRDLASHFAP